MTPTPDRLALPTDGYCASDRLLRLVAFGLSEGSDGMANGPVVSFLVRRSRGRNVLTPVFGDSWQQIVSEARMLAAEQPEPTGECVLVTYEPDERGDPAAVIAVASSVGHRLGGRPAPLPPGETVVEVSGPATPTTEGCPSDGDLPAHAFAVTLTNTVTDPARVTWYSEDPAQFAGLTAIAGPDGNLPAVATSGRTNTLVLCFPGDAVLPATAEEVAAHLRVVVQG